MTRTNLALHDLADGALLVEYPGLSDEEANARAVAAARALGRGALPGFLDAVPGARTLFVEFDPAETSRERLTRLLGKEESAGADASRRTLRIPVVYGGDAGRDLDEVAEAAGLSADEFARRHAQASYRVAFLGFAPGFAYLTGLPAELAAPRLSTPRTRVPAGSVAVAGPYTGIYPGETPGGWRLIGWTDVRLFDPDAHPPSLFLPGDGVRFEPVGREALGVFDRPIARSPDHPFPGIPILRVLSPGVFSSLQGAPGHGWSRYGVPPGGAMDPAALAAANALLGNPEDAAAIEMTLVGADLEALADANVCLEGAAPQVEHEGRAVRVGERIHLHAGDRLRVARILGGARTYLCVEGGLAQPQRPQISPRLASGDLLYGSPLPLTHSPSRPVPSSPRVPASPRPRVEGRSHSETRETVVRVVLDPRQGPFSKEGIATFLSAVYRISSSSDRRGIRLEGTPVALAEAPDISPEGTPLGGIQVARDGMPIVLGPDRPITGGYARIATVIRADFPLLAQAASGAAVRFAPVALAEALRARIG